MPQGPPTGAPRATGRRSCGLPGLYGPDVRPRPQSRQAAADGLGRGGEGSKGRTGSKPHPRAKEHRNGTGPSREPHRNRRGEKERAPSRQRGAGRRTGETRSGQAVPLRSPPLSSPRPPRPTQKDTSTKASAASSSYGPCRRRPRPTQRGDGQALPS